MSLRTVLKAALAAALAPLVLVLEGGKWVLRSMTNTHPLPVPVSAAEENALAALDREIDDVEAQQTFAAKSGREWETEHNFSYAVRAKEWLWSQAGDWLEENPDISVLPTPVQAWLQGLTPAQRERIKDRTHLSDLEQHLRGRQFSDLPRLLSEGELLARAEAAAADRQATHDILQSLIDSDESLARRAA